MMEESSEQVPQEEPSGPRTEPVQTGASAIARTRPPDSRAGIEQSRLASAIRESEAVRNLAAATVIQGWVQEDHERRRRTEDELQETRAHLDEERAARIRAETRLEEVTKNRTAQDMMILVGGAALGFGFSSLYAQAWALGAIGVVGGLLVSGAGFLLAGLPRKGPHG
jgi:hypothetical protein